MNLNRIALRFLFSKKHYSYTNISLYISVLTFSFAVAVSLVVIGMSRSYRADIEFSLQSIEPEVRITQKSDKYIKATYIDSIYSVLSSISKGNPDLYYSKYLEEYLMIKSSNKSKGLISYTVEDNISKFYNFIDLEEKDYDKYLFMSNSLIDKHNIDINDDIVLFNVAELIDNETLSANKLNISRSFTSGIPTFDDNVIFLSRNNLGRLSDQGELYSGIIIGGIDNNELEVLRLELINFPITFTTWKDKHRNILYWLTIFMNPFYLIISFMIILATIYQIFSNWLILYEKSHSLYQFRLIGISKNKIKRIYMYLSLMILSISLSLGYAMSIIFSFFQNNYNLIKLDPSVYILSQIKSNILISDFLILSIFTIIAIIISTIISFKYKGNTTFS